LTVLHAYAWRRCPARQLLGARRDPGRPMFHVNA
jgi:hypothetical protein